MWKMGSKEDEEEEKRAQDLVGRAPEEAPRKGEGVGTPVLRHGGVRLGPSLDGRAPPDHPS